MSDTIKTPEDMVGLKKPHAWTALDFDLGPTLRAAGFGAQGGAGNRDL